MTKSRPTNYNLIIGKNCVSQVARRYPERLVSVMTSHDKHDSLIQELSKHRIHIKSMSRKGLDDLSGSSSHQGYVAQVQPKKHLFVEDLIERAESKAKSMIVMLDSIFDPQNLGAILRACECFGVDGVIISKNRGCSITPTVTKTSVGASEIVPVAQVSNLATTMQKLQKAGYWSVSTEISDKATELTEFEFPEKTLLILGSEGKGVQQLISKKADFHLYIPMQGQIDSLNVSQATAVILYSFNK